MTPDQLKAVEHAVRSAKVNQALRSVRSPDGSIATAWPWPGNGRRISWKLCDASGRTIERGVYRNQ